MCGSSTSETTHTYATANCGQQEILTAALDPGNGCCDTAEKSASLTLPACGGTGTGGSPCPWWNPFCASSNLCSGLLIAGLAAAIAGGILIMAAVCNPNPILPYVAGAVGALGFILLGFWYAVCRRLPGFCAAATWVLNFLQYVIFLQGLIAIAVSVGISIPGICILGAWLSFAYYASIAFYLWKLYNAAGCPPYVSPVFPPLVRQRKHEGHGPSEQR